MSTSASSQIRQLRLPSGLDLGALDSSADWLGKIRDFAKLATAVAGVAPFPFIQTAGGVVLILLEMLEVCPHQKVRCTTEVVNRQ